MSRLLQVLLLVVSAECLLAAAPGGSSLPKTSPPAFLLPRSQGGVALPLHGQFTPHPVGKNLVCHRLNGVQFVARGLGARPVRRRALCAVAVAVADGPGDINAGGDLAEAKERLVKAERELVAVEDVLRKAEEVVPVDAQRVSKAELGVAKAEVGVAKAEVGVAKAEWQAALGDEKDVFLDSFKTAQERFRTANVAYEKALNAPTATLQQGDATPPQETWVVLDFQASGLSIMSPTTITFQSSQKILVDGLKKATVKEFRLKGVNACDLIVSATSGGESINADLAVEALSCGKNITAPLFIRRSTKPEPLSPPTKNVAYVKEKFYSLDDEAPQVPDFRYVSFKGQKDFKEFLDQMQAGGMVADSDRKKVIRDFHGLIEGELYWLETRDSLTQSVKGLDAWTKNQDAALEDEVTRCVWTFGNATLGGKFVLRPDLRNVKRKEELRVGEEQCYIEWDGVLCNEQYVLLLEAKQKVFVNLTSHNSSQSSVQTFSKAVGDTLDLVLGKRHKFADALLHGELENKDFEQLRHRKLLVFLGARLFPESAKDLCLKEGVHPVFSNGNSFCVDNRTLDGSQ